MLTEKVELTITLVCDGPPSCPSRPVVTNTATGLLQVMKAQGWRLPDIDGDGRIDPNAPCYCGYCVKVLQAAGKL